MKHNVTESGKTLSPKQSRAIPFLIEASSIEEGAKIAGVSRVTVYRWMAEAAFKKRLEDERQRTFEESLNRLKGATGQAIDKLVELIGSDEKNISRLAAQSVLSFAFKTSEVQDLEARITHIEEILETRMIS